MVSEALAPTEEEDLSIIRRSVSEHEQFTAFTKKEDAEKAARHQDYGIKDNPDFRGFHFPVIEFEVADDKGLLVGDYVTDTETISEGVYAFTPNQTNEFTLKKAFVGENFKELDLIPADLEARKAQDKKLAEEAQAERQRREEAKARAREAKAREAKAEEAKAEQQRREEQVRGSRDSKGDDKKQESKRDDKKQERNGKVNNSYSSLLGKIAAVVIPSAVLQWTGFTAGLLGKLAINATLLSTGLASIGLGLAVYTLGSYTVDYFKDKRTKAQRYKDELTQANLEVAKLSTEARRQELPEPAVVKLLEDLYQRVDQLQYTHDGEIDSAANQPEHDQLMVKQYERSVLKALAPLKGKDRQTKEEQLLAEARTKFSL